MARIKVVEPEQASPDIKEIYDKKLGGKPANVHKALAQRPEIFKAFLSFYPTVGNGFDKRLYELVYIRVSMLNRCGYCMQHHISSSKKAGLTAQDWNALSNPASANFSDKEKAALAFAEKLTRTPWEINDRDIAALKQHFSDAEIVELDLLVGLINLTNRFTAPLALELEFPEEKIATSSAAD